MWRALAWLASAVGSRRGSTAARGNRRGVGARVAGANRPQQQQQQQQQQPQRQQGEEGAADGTHRSDSVGDEEMGGREAAGHGGDGGEHFFVGGEVEAAGGFSSGSTSGLSGSSYAGRDAGSTGVGRGVGGAAGPSWYAALGFRKPSGMDGGGREGVICASSGGGGGARLGHHGGGGIAGGDARSAGAADGYGKKTVRRSLPAGDGRVFEALPGESYFRVRAAEGPAARGNAASKVAGVAWPKPRPRPSIGDSLPAGRCSLAIVIRPAGAADTTGDWTRWRHRPTHRVTHQVCLCVCVCCIFKYGAVFSPVRFFEEWVGGWMPLEVTHRRIRFASISFGILRRRSVSFGIMRYRAVSFGVIRCRSASFGFFRRHSVSVGVFIRARLVESVDFAPIIAQHYFPHTVHTLKVKDRERDLLRGISWVPDSVS